MKMVPPLSSAVSPHAVSQASVLDTLAVLRDVVVPTLGKGPLIRRRAVVTLAERIGLDDRAVRRMQALRDKYGPGPLLLRIPLRHQAVILSAEDASAVLEGSPEPFAADSLEKRSALNHFQPNAVLSSHGRDRAIRRHLNEETLQTGCPVYAMAAHFSTIVDQEMDEVCRQAADSGRLDWDIFFTGWFRMVRRIVLGDAARDDTDLTDLLEKLRRRANYAFFRGKDRRSREVLLDRLRGYVDQAEPGSLAGRMAQAWTDPNQQPHHQLPQYLFAFDPGGMGTFRTLALLSTHPQVKEQVHRELSEVQQEGAPELPFLRACFLDALRLWPTTPAILRETTQTVSWGQGQLDQATQILIFTPFLHRDDKTLPQAHRFDPSLWSHGNSRPDLGLFPFSEGAVVCPAVNFVPTITTLAMRRILSRLQLRLNEPERITPARLPGTLDVFTLSFQVEAMQA
ncbi:cytochrome P450 [Paracoccus sp. (in: a-proteobacteria)]|uniref:cytochrome P450 n=1 Tax=Paracoccus sp. TaxID=267 RepID=UPI00396CFEF7